MWILSQIIGPEYFNEHKRMINQCNQKDFSIKPQLCTCVFIFNI